MSLLSDGALAASLGRDGVFRGRDSVRAPAVIHLTPRNSKPWDDPIVLRNASDVDAVLGLNVAFIGDDWSDLSIAEMNQDGVSRLLLHRLEVLQAAMNRVAELQREAACAPQPGEEDEQ